MGSRRRRVFEKLLCEVANAFAHRRVQGESRTLHPWRKWEVKNCAMGGDHWDIGSFVGSTQTHTVSLVVSLTLVPVVSVPYIVELTTFNNFLLEVLIRCGKL